MYKVTRLEQDRVNKERPVIQYFDSMSEPEIGFYVYFAGEKHLRTNKVTEINKDEEGNLLISTKSGSVYKVEEINV